MPVYNEAAALQAVVAEWLPVLEHCAVDVTLCLIDDGSTDATATVLQQLAREHPQVEVVTKANTGHGRTCLHGYRLAIERGAPGSCRSIPMDSAIPPALRGSGAFERSTRSCSGSGASGRTGGGAAPYRGCSRSVPALRPASGYATRTFRTGS